MKKVILKKIGWRERTPEEKAEVMRKLGDLLIERRTAHDRLKELAPLIRAARRAPDGKIRGPLETVVEFDGVSAAKVDGKPTDSGHTAVKRALKILDPFQT